LRVRGWGQADMLVQVQKRWLSAGRLARLGAVVIKEFSRKRNKFFRHLDKHYGVRTPLRFAHCWNFDCELVNPDADPLLLVATATKH